MDHTPDSRVTKIAQSDTWTALARVASVVGTCILVPIGGWVAYSEWQNSVALSAHTTSIDDIKASVDSIDRKSGEDHDHISHIDGLILVIQSKLDQLPMLWNAISHGQQKQNDKSQPPP
jgi:hypothetical protein